MPCKVRRSNDSQNEIGLRPTTITPNVPTNSAMRAPSWISARSPRNSIRCTAALKGADRATWVVQARWNRGADRQLGGGFLPFASGRQLCVIERPLRRIASTPAVGQKRTCGLTAVTCQVSPTCHIRTLAAHPDRVPLLIAEKAPSAATAHRLRGRLFAAGV